MPVIALVLGVAILGFLVIRVFFWSKIKDKISFPNTLKVNALRFCEDLTIRPNQLTIKMLCAQNDKEMKAWNHLPQLYIKWVDGKLYLPVSDRDCIPLDFFGVLTQEERDVLSDAFVVAEAAADNVSLTAAKEDMQNRIATLIGIIAGSAALLLAIVVIANLWGK